MVSGLTIENKEMHDDTLTKDEQALRELFVDEYLKDYNSIQAAQRIGFMYSFAEDYGPSFLQESFVQRLISEREQQASVSPEVELQQALSAIKSQAGYYGADSSHGSRIKALTYLADYYKEVISIEDMDDRPRGGVMAVPEMLNAEAWSGVASMSQEKLKASVRD